MVLRRRAGLLSACAAALALAGCTSGSATGGPGATPPTSRPTAPAPASSTPAPVSTDMGSPTTPPSPSTTPGTPGTVSLSFSDNGKPVHLKVGERLHIALSSTYWTFRGSDTPHVLRHDASGIAKPTATCSGPVGSGCGTRTADFTAVGKGHSSVVATRTTCGEAMRCVGANGRFVVYVTVG